MPKKILLADDSITIQKVVELTFSDGDYEVTAVNNGAKAIQKLAEMRPDIVLSDIIMPEKNGYEVCEYVKSHPEYRHLPVVLLTGTFEPFDPDRAEKAGCDAVVTKPFESQSLIQKVEELIAQSQSSPVAEPEPAEPQIAQEPEEESAFAPAAASPWIEEAAPAARPDASSPFSTPSGAFPAAAEEPFTHGTEVFGGGRPSDGPVEMPFEEPQDADPFAAPPEMEASRGETRGFPPMSFDDFQQSDSAPREQQWTGGADAPETSSRDERPAETSGFEAPSFASFGGRGESQPDSGATGESDSPFGAPPDAEQFSAETRAFPRVSADELQQLSQQAAAQDEARSDEPAGDLSAPWGEPERSSFDADAVPAAVSDGFERPERAEERRDAAAWTDDAAPAFGGETTAFPKVSFDDFQQQRPEEAQEPTPWNEQPEAPAFGGETTAFPKMSFDDFQPQAETQASPWDAPAEEPSREEPQTFGEPAADPFARDAGDTDQSEGSAGEAASASSWSEPAPISWSPSSDSNTPDASGESFSTAGAAPFSEPSPEDMPSASQTTATDRDADEKTAERPWSPAAAAARADADADEPAIPSTVIAADTPAIPIAAPNADLSDEQVDRIARRVIELMSDQLVRNIAWEVIPDLAEMVVKERIRQLESEA